MLYWSSARLQNITRGKKRPRQQFRTALRLADGTLVKDRTLAERALRRWLADLENIVREAVSADEHLVLLKEEEGHVALIAGGLAKRWLDVQRPNLKPRCIERTNNTFAGWHHTSKAFHSARFQLFNVRIG